MKAPSFISFLFPLLLWCQAGLASPAMALKGTAWETTARAYKLDPLLMYAVALQESRRMAGQGFIAPHPYAMNSSSTGPHYPATQVEAINTLEAELESAANIDICPMQISLRWNGKLVERPSDLLQISTCLDVGARLLADAIASSPTDLELGIGRYHTWNPKRESDARRYGRNVLRIWINLLKASS